jgi:hypothetical protein
MPARAYRHTHPHARRRLLARLAAGEHLAQICVEADMPSYASVHAWARAEPGFAAELAAARRRGAFIRRGAFDAAKGEPC